eukprot:TRINITY_DN7732_c0_g1_i1.p1 TRINITY_DN7732_c0_g1~~TRINITY_DN7732_c0_g1_i1.p1  ORF type:complete len:140 (+),score=17.99 TRINITY_DN7732_c0_g1_i1:55-474(+)
MLKKCFKPGRCHWWTNHRIEWVNFSEIIMNLIPINPFNMSNKQGRFGAFALKRNWHNHLREFLKLGICVGMPLGIWRYVVVDGNVEKFQEFSYNWLGLGERPLIERMTKEKRREDREELAKIRDMRLKELAKERSQSSD